VVAGARRTEELAPLVGQYGERVKPVENWKCATKPPQKRPCSWQWIHSGRLDVLVNNAGYGQFAPFEQIERGGLPGDRGHLLLRRVYTTRAAVPVMRKQKGGHIFQVSSVGGRHAVPGNTPYHAAKWRWAVSATRWRWKSRPSESRSAHWSRRYSDQLGTARRSECAGPAARVRGHGRFVPDDVARPRRASGRRSAKDRRM